MTNVVVLVARLQDAEKLRLRYQVTLPRLPAFTVFTVCSRRRNFHSLNKFVDLQIFYCRRSTFHDSRTVVDLYTVYSRRRTFHDSRTVVDLYTVYSRRRTLHDSSTVIDLPTVFSWRRSFHNLNTVIDLYTCQQRRPICDSNNAIGSILTSVASIIGYS